MLRHITKTYFYMHEVGQLFIQIEFWILLDIRDSVSLYETLVQFWMEDLIAKGKQLSSQQKS